jgi:hypothetical protein
MTEPESDELNALCSAMENLPIRSWPEMSEQMDATLASIAALLDKSPVDSSKLVSTPHDKERAE